MKHIEIITPQNVTVEYQLASVLDRGLAWLLDIAIMGGASFILALILNDYALYLIIPVVFLYTLLFETLNNGQSLGKRVLKIRVVKLTGEASSLFDYILRWVFRLVDIYTNFGIVAILSISSSTKGQRIGDYLSNMTVIKIDEKERFGINYIMKIQTLENYTPEYPVVKNMTEEEMVLVKETVERYMKYQNNGHTQALELLLSKIEEKLGISPPRDKIRFLNTLIKDYVALTR